MPVCIVTAAQYIFTELVLQNQRCFLILKYLGKGDR